MKRFLGILMGVALLAANGADWADEYSDATALFKNAKESNSFFSNCYGYAIFPSIGKGACVVGAAHGNGRVYAKGEHRDTSMTQVSVGLQAGGQAYSQIIFFEDQRSFDERPL